MKLGIAVNLLIVNEKNQLLLAKRSSIQGSCANMWSIPGGTCELNEIFEETLVREIKEELGCKVSDYKYFKSYLFELREDFFVKAVYFYGNIDGEIKLNDELSECKWYDIDDEKIFDLDFAFNQKEVVKDFVSFYKNRNKK